MVVFTYSRREYIWQSHKFSLNLFCCVLPSCTVNNSRKQGGRQSIWGSWSRHEGCASPQGGWTWSGQRWGQTAGRWPLSVTGKNFWDNLKTDLRVTTALVDVSQRLMMSSSSIIIFVSVSFLFFVSSLSLLPSPFQSSFSAPLLKLKPSEFPFISTNRTVFFLSESVFPSLWNYLQMFWISKKPQWLVSSVEGGWVQCVREPESSFLLFSSLESVA